MKYDRVIVLSCAINFVESLGYGIVLPLIPFVAQRFGANDVAIGSIFALYSVCQLLTAPFIGRWSDTAGRKPWLIASQCSTLLGFVVLGFANSLWLILLSRAIDGISAGNVSLLYTLVLDRHKPGTRAPYFGLLATTTGLGALCGPIIGAFLGAQSLALPAFVAAGLSLLTLLATIFFLPETRVVRTQPAPRAAIAVFKDGAIRRILHVTLANNIIFNAFLLALPVFMQTRFGFTLRDVGVMISVMFAFAAVFQVGAVQRLLHGVALTRLAWAGFGLYGLAFSILVFAGPVWLAGVGAVLVVWALVVLNPVLGSLLSDRAGTAEEGWLMGINQSVGSIGQIAGPIIGYGALFLIGDTGFALICLCLTAIGAGLFLRVQRDA